MSGLSEVNQGEENEEQVSRATLVRRAIKLPIYTVALVPLTVGSAAAYLQVHTFDAGRYFVLLFSSVLIITWLNLSNDAYDFETGADRDKKESVVNISAIQESFVLHTFVLPLALQDFYGLLCRQGMFELLLCYLAQFYVVMSTSALHVDYPIMDWENHCALQHLDPLPQVHSTLARQVKVKQAFFALAAQFCPYLFLLVLQLH